MIKYLKELFSLQRDETNPADKFKDNKEKKLQIATCAILLEIANADNEFSAVERKKIIKVMQITFDIEREYVEELIELSEEKIKSSIGFFEFTTIINENFSNDEKYELLKNLWRLIYIDDTLNAHEDHLVKRIGKTLNMQHRDVISAKLMVKEENK